MHMFTSYKKIKGMVQSNIGAYAAILQKMKKVHFNEK